MVDSDQLTSSVICTVGLVASHRSWRAELARHVQDHITGIRVRVLRDPRAADEGIDVIVIDDSSTFLNRDSLRRLTDTGVLVVGIYDPTERHGRGQSYLSDMGVSNIASAEMSPAQLVDLIWDITNDTDQGSQTGTLGELDPPEIIPQLDIGEPGTVQMPTGRGAVITVGGPLRSATVEFAVALAAQLAHQTRESALAIDLDEASPLLAARLGYRLDPTVLDAMERLQYGDGDLRHCVTDPTHGSKGFCPMHVMAGIANPDDWALLGRDRTEDLLERTATQWNYVVSTSGPTIHPMPQGTERFGASRQAIASADLVVGVLEPSPLGLLQGLDWIIDVRRLAGEQPIWILFAGRPRSPVHRADLVTSLTREAGRDAIAGAMFVPYGAEVDRARWEGRPVSRGPFHRAIKNLVGEIVPDPDSQKRSGVETSHG